MASVKLPPSLPQTIEYTHSLSPEHPCDDGLAEDTEEVMPYHAREYARPFTYGNLPAGFKITDLNHVAVENTAEEMKSVNWTGVVVPPSPVTLRKSTRPSISPSRPLLRKTPTRQEFEEMLLERREQALREQRTFAIQQAQNAAIQKDLDDLQQILNETIFLKPKPLQREKKTPQSIDIETFRLSDEAENTRVVRDDDNSENPSTRLEVAEVVADARRPETPAFPDAARSSLDERCVSPYPMVTPGTPTLQRLHSSAVPIIPKPLGGKPNRKAEPLISSAINDPHDVAPHLVKFAKDYSEFWYKPHISREEAVALLRNAAPGTFIIRNSTTYKNAFGLVMRVDKTPHGVAVPENSSGEELVRHFLVEPTTRGVRLKGCANEPVFTSLSALVYQHSINQMALPFKLTIPEYDLLLSVENYEIAAAQKQLLMQGAACNVLYLFSCDMESLTGDEALRKAVCEMYLQRPLPKATEVHFKVSQQGITLTDNTRRLFFRRHYAPHNISHCGVDPENRFWSVAADDESLRRTVNKTIFGFVARKLAGSSDNQCHVFCDMAASQPASAIVSFANKVVPMDKRNHRML